MRSRILLFLLIATAIATTPHSALAAWPHNPGTNLAVCTISRDQIVPTSVSDGTGGAIVAWHDFRSTFNYDVYAQHVLASGVLDPAWPAGGRALCTNASNQSTTTISSDGSGGAIVAWQDNRGGSSDIYAQHVLSSGAVDPSWPADGRALCTAANNQFSPVIVPDGVGGAIVTWYDFRSGTNSDIYAQHVLAGGAVDPLWPADGRAFCSIANNQESPMIAADGAGGAIVTWDEQRSGSYAVFAHHVLANGALDAAWPADGRALTSVANNQYGAKIVSDGAGGGIVTWRDVRSGVSYDIFAQHMLARGAVDPLWPADGVALCTAAGDQYFPAITVDGMGGAIVTWHDPRNSNNDLYAQHVLASGAADPSWPADGQALSTAATNQQSPTIVSDGSNGAIVAWQDARSGSGNSDIYAQRVARFGYLGTPEPIITGVRDVPNDQGGKVKLSWDASWLDYESNPWVVNYYKIYRSGAPNAPGFSAHRDPNHGTDVTDLREREFLAQLERATGYSWEYIAYVYAEHVSFITSYSYIAPTLSDSIGAYNPTTAFLVAAFDTYGSMYWASAPANGYSVDNLPPYAPAPFTGQYGAGIAAPPLGSELGDRRRELPALARHQLELHAVSRQSHRLAPRYRLFRSRGPGLLVQALSGGYPWQ